MIAPSEDAITKQEPFEIEHEIEEPFDEGGPMHTWLRVIVTVVAITAVVVLIARFGTRLARR